MDDPEVRNLLPVKQKNGKWVYPVQTVIRSEVEDNVLPKQSDLIVKSTVAKVRSLAEKYALEQKRLKLLKVKIGMLCTSITANPVSGLRDLKALITMLQKPNTKMIITEKKLLALSLLHVFNDILPSYKIRNIQEPDTKLKLKKETKILLTHELSLLRHYKKYLDSLQQMVNDMKCKRRKTIITPAKKKAIMEIGVIATRCLCELLVNRCYFNYHKTIISIVVPLVGNRNGDVSNICCSAIEKLYKTDKLGEASLEVVKQTVKVVKERNFAVPGELLRTFLALNLQEVKIGESKKKDMKEVRKQLDAMSRKEKRHKKKMRELEQQLRETEAHESKEAKSKLQTETLKKMFWIYFHVLKDDEKMGLLAPVLEGLSKFAHLINLEFFDDLNSVLCSLMEREALGDTEKLHCIQTVFVILSGQAESLNVDPQHLYGHFYRILLNVNHTTSIEQFTAILQCFNYMFLKRKKKITANRFLAFIKRLCTMCLQAPVHFALASLNIVRLLMGEVKNSDILLDTENVGSGVFSPQLDDPEYCNASSTSLWELHLLIQHCNPIVSDYARHILHNCPLQGKLRLPDWLSKLTPEKVLTMSSAQVLENNLDFQKYKSPVKRRKTA